MTELALRIREMIEADGPIGVDRYMALALQDPRHGYYMTRDPFGSRGDFVTAPEISQIFGELLGLWAADLWDRMGRPNPLRLIELGPGRGTLAADALRAARAMDGFLRAVDLILVETSPALRERQKETLTGAPLTPSWVGAFEQAPAGPAIVIANEFLDALPLRQFVRDGDRWRERLVGLDEDGRLAFGLSAAPTAEISIEAPPGTCLEAGLEGLALMDSVARRLVEQGGCALVIDYGGASGFADTLQGLRGGAPVDPLRFPGESDLTAHVDFRALGRMARRAGARTFGPVEQGRFLRELGLERRLERLCRGAGEAARARLESGARRLIDRSAPTAMGTLFKALAIASPDAPAPGGFGGES